MATNTQTKPASQPKPAATTAKPAAAPASSTSSPERKKRQHVKNSDIKLVSDVKKVTVEKAPPRTRHVERDNQFDDLVKDSYEQNFEDSDNVYTVTTSTPDEVVRLIRSAATYLEVGAFIRVKDLGTKDKDGTSISEVFFRGQSKRKRQPKKNSPNTTANAEKLSA